MLSLRALGMKMMFFQVVFRVSGPRGPEKNYNFHKLGDKNYNFHKFQFLGSFGLFSPGTGPGMVGDRFLMKFCVDWYHGCLKWIKIFLYPPRIISVTLLRLTGTIITIIIATIRSALLRFLVLVRVIFGR